MRMIRLRYAAECSARRWGQGESLLAPTGQWGHLVGPNAAPSVTGSDHARSPEYRVIARNSRTAPGRGVISLDELVDGIGTGGYGEALPRGMPR